MSAAWLLAGIAVLVWPRRRPVMPDGRTSDRPAMPRVSAQRDALLAPVAGVGAALTVILLGGVPAGLVAAAVVGPAAGFGVGWLRGRPRYAPPDRHLPLCLDLVAAVLRSGRPLESALESAATAAGPAAERALTRVARLLTLGADPREAWATCAQPGSVLEPVAAVAVRSRTSGLKLADAFERLAADLRAERATAATTRAARAGVHAMGPLAACFLPSFVCLGIVPLVVGVAAAATKTLR